MCGELPRTSHSEGVFDSTLVAILSYEGTGYSGQFSCTWPHNTRARAGWLGAVRAVGWYKLHPSEDIVGQRPMARGADNQDTC